MKVGIVLVNYNGIKFLPDCLASLVASDYSSAEMLLVDNASTDGSPEWIASHFPQVVLLRQTVNGGFASGCNIGIRWCLAHGYDYVLLLNNDTTVAPDFLSCLMKYAEPGRLLAPKIYFDDDRSRINNHLGEFDYWRGIHRDLFYGCQDTEASCQVQDVTMANGCALLIPVDIIKKVGLLDETFFMYSEDIDFIVRAVRAGASVTFVPQAVIYHRESASSGGQGSPLAIYYTTRNRLYLMFKLQPNKIALIFFLIYFSLTRIVVAVMYLLRGQRAQFKALVHAIIDYCRGRMGYTPPSRFQP